MATMNENDIAVLASKRLKQGQGAILPLMSMCQNALNNLSRQVANDTDRRRLLLTNQTTATASITGYVDRYYADLSTLQSSPGIMLDTIRLGTTFFAPSVTATPYNLNNGTYASGYWQFVSNPQPNETIAVNGVTFTFIASSVVLASAGEASMNGTYTYRGQYEGYPVYTLSGDPDPFGDITASNSVYSDGNLWYANSGTYGFYYTSDVADYPWDATGWTTNGPTNPAPTFTEGTFTSAQVEIGLTVAETAANFAAKLTASANASITVASYTIADPPARQDRVIGTYDTQGTGGNAFTLANSSNGSITRSAATFTGGAATAYALSIGTFTDFFEELSRVQFTTTVTLPTGISASTDYYLTDYTIDGDVATFNLSSTADGLTPVTISAAGSGVLTMQSYTPTVCQWLNSPNQGLLTPAIPVDYTYIWLEQNLLYTNRATGTFSFTVPYVPATVELLPAQLQNDLVDEVVQLAITAGFEPITESEK